jgi:hypothetical protein
VVVMSGRLCDRHACSNPATGLTWWRGVLPTYSDGELEVLSRLINDVIQDRAIQEMLVELPVGTGVSHKTYWMGEGMVVPQPAGYPAKGKSGPLVWWIRFIDRKVIGSYPWNLRRV